MRRPAAILLAALVICTTLTTAHKCIHDEIMRGAPPYFTSQGLESSEPEGAVRVEPAALGIFDIFGLKKETYQPIRIAVYSFDLDDSTKYCVTAGAERPDFQGERRECTPEDVLTADKKRILLTELMPAAIKLHSERLLVKPLVGPHFQTKWTLPGCNQFTVPNDHQAKGVTGADYYIYLAAGPTPAGTMAWAGACARLADGRPVSGVVNVNPKKIVHSRRMIRVLAHEILHALGFDRDFFKMSKLISTVDTPVRGKDGIPVINSKLVLARAREHYGCKSAPGMELEDFGGGEVALSHWKRRNAKDELMAGMESEGYYTAITIAAMEDLGYYKGNYAKAEHMPWGYKAGCKLLDEKCVENGVSQNPMMFCTDEGLKEDFCTSDRRGLGGCWNRDIGHVAPHFQYFGKKMRGSPVRLKMDYCPYVYEVRNARCNHGQGKKMPGSIISATSRCFVSEDGLKVKAKDVTHTLNGICVDVKCNTAAQTYRVRVLGATRDVPCTPGQKISPMASNPEGFAAGTIVCPAYEELCRELNPLAAVSGAKRNRATTVCVAVAGLIGSVLLVSFALSG